MEQLLTCIGKVTLTISQLIDDGFEINKLIVSNSKRTTIILFKNEKCNELIKKGCATFSDVPVKQGIFYKNDIKVVWYECLF
jgi:hypothetical protein